MQTAACRGHIALDSGLCSGEFKIAHKVFAQNCKLYSNNHLKYKVNFSQLPFLKLLWWKGIDTVVINSRVFIDKKDVWVIVLPTPPIYSKTFAKETKREEMDSSEMSLCLPACWCLFHWFLNFRSRRVKGERIRASNEESRRFHNHQSWRRPLHY